MNNPKCGDLSTANKKKMKKKIYVPLQFSMIRRRPICMVLHLIKHFKAQLSLASSICLFHSTTQISPYAEWTESDYNTILPGIIPIFVVSDFCQQSSFLLMLRMKAISEIHEFEYLQGVPVENCGFVTCSKRQSEKYSAFRIIVIVA